MKTKTSPKMTVKQKRSNGWHFLSRHKEGSIPQHMQLWRLRQPGQNHSGGIPAERESEQKTAHGLSFHIYFKICFINTENILKILSCLIYRKTIFSNYNCLNFRFPMIKLF